MTVLEKRYTVTEFEQIARRPENQNRLLELIDGEIVEKVVTEEYGIITGRIITRINPYLEQNPIGRAGVEISHQPAGDDENERMPDVSFRRTTDAPVVREGAVSAMPDLAVEIKSPHNIYKLLRDKATFYLAHGTKLVWLVYPERRIVEVQTEKEILPLGEENTLEGGEVLPGFKLAVSDIFKV